MARPTITKITVEIDGKTTIEIKDPGKTAALFFTDSAVKDILAGYYNSTGATTTASDLVNKWDNVYPDALGVIKRPNCTYEVLP